MTPIEAAARALCPGDPETQDELWREYAADARAAVTAFLEAVGSDVIYPEARALMADLKELAK